MQTSSDPTQLETVFDQYLDDLEAGYFSQQKHPLWLSRLLEFLPEVLSEPFNTLEGSSEAYSVGWDNLCYLLDLQAHSLPLPKGATHPLEALPSSLHHRLILQSCLEWLTGIGREGISLADDVEQGRVEALYDDLLEHPDTLRYFNFTVHSLNARLQMPAIEHKHFIDLSCNLLQLPDTQTPLMAYLLRDNK